MMNADYYKRYEPLFGKWTIEKKLGSGSYGSVFQIQCRDNFDGTVYHSALKAITVPSSEDDAPSLLGSMDEKSTAEYYRSFVKELTNEIHLMSRLKGHTNIVSYEDHMVYPHEDGIGWDVLIRMELLTPIHQHFQPMASIPSQEVVKLGIDMCRALEVCQKYNIIHRDIKPANIFISETGDYKLGDFGVARIASAATGASTFAGTTYYMAPEIQRGGKYTASVDIYSLGLVMYQLLNGRRMPFFPQPPQVPTPDILRTAQERRLAGEPLPQPVYADPQLAAVVLKACAPAPADRFADPTQMRRALEALSEPPVQPDFAEEATVRAAAPVQTPADGERTTRFFAGQTTPPQPARAAAARTPKPAPDSDATLFLFAEQEKQRQEAERARRLQQEQLEQQRRLQFDQQEQQRQQQLNEKRWQAELARQQAQAQAEAARKAAAPAPAPAPTDAARLLQQYPRIRNIGWCVAALCAVVFFVTPLRNTNYIPIFDLVYNALDHNSAIASFFSSCALLLTVLLALWVGCGMHLFHALLQKKAAPAGKNRKLPASAVLAGLAAAAAFVLFCVLLFVCIRYFCIRYLIQA